MGVEYKGASRRTFKPLSRGELARIFARWERAARRWGMRPESYPTWERLVSAPVGACFDYVNPATAERFTFRVTES